MNDPREDQPVNFDSDLLEDVNANNLAVFITDLSLELSLNNMKILKQFGKMLKLGNWVPHELSPANHQHRLDVYAALHPCQLQEPFLDKVVIGDKKK